MALTSNIRIVEYPRLNSEIVYLSKATSTHEFAAGDLIEADSYAGSCKVVNDADKSAFIGVAISSIEGANTLDPVGVALRGVARVLLASGQTTIYFGEMAAWSTGANGTDWSFANTATEAIMHCLDASILGGAYGNFVFDAYTVRAVTALGFWEVPA